MSCHAETQKFKLTEMQRAELADEIRDRVARNALTYVWLIKRLSDHGLFTDKYEMSSVLSGVRGGPKADCILTESISVLDEYEEGVT